MQTKITLHRKALKRLPFYDYLRNLRQPYSQKRQLEEWKRNGEPVPPPHLIKQQMIKDCAKRHNLQVFIETGTYYGDMVEAVMDTFSTIYSIELSAQLADKAKRRFRKAEKVEIIQGNSKTVLEDLVSKLNRPTFFWLDGHFAGGETARGDEDTPIFGELMQIFKTPPPRYVVYIDDARCFGSKDYPSYPRIEALLDFIAKARNDLDIEVAYDSVRIVPKVMRFENSR